MLTFRIKTTSSYRILTAKQYIEAYNNIPYQQNSDT